MTSKEAILKAVQGLPDDITIDDAMDRLYLLYKIQKGIEEMDAGLGIPQKEVEESLREWLE